MTNIVWAEAHGDAEAVGRFPVKYKKSMAESGFSAEYYRELVYSHVDNVNLLYVALTRAAESLHVFIPQKGGKTVGGLLLQSILTDGDKAPRGQCRRALHRHRNGRAVRIRPVPRPGRRRRQNVRRRARRAGKLPHGARRPAPAAPSQRYFEQEEEVELSPRNFGILMHKAFENADDEEQIRLAVERMQADGTLSAAEAAALRRMIARALEHPAAREWFAGGWERVRNENEIIIPGGASARRPDRVMIRGTRAVVVDYKFGGREPERYRRQVREYLALLRQMGYTETEGYLWYVKLGKNRKGGGMT